jgi:hypothetical protein
MVPVEYASAHPEQQLTEAARAGRVRTLTGTYGLQTCSLILYLPSFVSGAYVPAEELSSSYRRLVPPNPVLSCLLLE